MARPGDVLEIPELGIRVEFRRTAEQTDGALVSAEFVGRPRGLIARSHVHPSQVERYGVLSGAMRLEVAGREQILRAGQSTETPAGVPHRQLAGESGPGRVRIELRPALRTEQFLERLASMSQQGRFNRWGYPRPVAGAELVRDFGAEAYAAQPPVAVQRALADALLRAARLLDRAGGEYVFVDEWDVAAPIEAVHGALADARTYPDWWRPVYIDVDADGPPAVGQVSRQRFKGRLPYHLRTCSTLTRLEPPRLIQADVEGDLRGRGNWTLTPTADGTHVRFDWRVYAERPLLRLLTPVLRPVLRWNHDWAIARAIEGLEPYARRHAGGQRDGTTSG